MQQTPISISASILLAKHYSMIKNLMLKNIYKMLGDIFNTPFFDVLKSYIHDNNKSSGYVQSILNIPLTDAKEIYAELS